MKRIFLVFCTAGLLTAAAGVSAAPKNVILMITDGRSYGALDAARHYRGKASVYQGRGWTKLSMTTTSANNDAATNPHGYDPAKAWESDGKGGSRPNQAYLKTNATDSASGITAIVTGQKNRDGQINWSVDGKPLTNFAQIYHAAGRATGAVSTVNWTHATPGGIGAHNASRNNYVDIATEMLTTSGLDVIMGAGNPMFDNNGKPLTTADYRHVGEANWAKLRDGSYGYTLIQGRDEFVTLASAPTTPARVCGTFQALATAQQGRDGYEATDTPGSDPRNANIPTLGEMALAALNVLDNNPKGFFVMMEGGAIDWAAHANQAARLIEEHQDFDTAVKAVSKWVEKNSSWNDTLVIITSDHGNGMITGPDGGTFITNNGRGRMPGLKFNSGGHTNELVPLFARGSGSELLKWFVRGEDPVRGKYIENTDVFRVMQIATGMR
jgi:alkaline phosphatase